MPLPGGHDTAPARQANDSKEPFGGFYRHRKALITGGLGFLGSNLAQRLVQCGADVTLLDSLAPYGGGSHYNISAVRHQVTLHVADMRDPVALADHVRDQACIFHLAGHASHTASMRDPRLDLDCNCAASLNLVETCRRHAPRAELLYTSTRQVYGRPQRLPVTEDHPAIPIDVNGIHKLAAEQYHLLYDSVYGLRSTVLRLTNTYGPRQKISDDAQGVAAAFLRHALRGEPIELFAGGGQRRDFNYVDDVVDALLRAMSSPHCRGKVYHLGAERAHSLLEFVDILRELCDFEVRCVPFPQDEKMIDIGDYYGDYSAFHKATGWRPITDLEEGLRRTIAFYREHQEGYW
jgi:UDP-glucose 4-epimerase